MLGTKGPDDVRFAEEVAALGAAHGLGNAAAAAGGLRAYADLLLAWTARINLTAARDLDTIVAQHFPDSFCLAGAVAPAQKVVDVGSGGGLPALPLALLRPDLTIRLVEPIAKKAAFLRTAVRELGLAAQLTVDGRRAEALTAEAPGAFDAATSRAVLAPAAWVELALPLVRPGGQIFVLASEDFAGGHPDVERRASRAYFSGRRFLIELHRRFT